jgi:hypothetical protein
MDKQGNNIVDSGTLSVYSVFEGHGRHEKHNSAKDTSRSNHLL